MLVKARSRIIEKEIKEKSRIKFEEAGRPIQKVG